MDLHKDEFNKELKELLKKFGYKYCSEGYNYTNHDQFLRAYNPENMDILVIQTENDVDEEDTILNLGLDDEEFNKLEEKYKKDNSEVEAFKLALNTLVKEEFNEL